MKYTKAMIEVIELNAEDVVLTSTCAADSTPACPTNSTPDCRTEVII